MQNLSLNSQKNEFTDSCVEISKFLKSENTTENDGNTPSKLYHDTSLLGKVSRWNLSF